MSMETDAQSYTGAPMSTSAEPTADEASTSVAARAKTYRQALADAARSGTLTDDRGAQIADRWLRAAAASPAAAALINFEYALHGERQAALRWSGGKTTQSSTVLILERLAANAEARLAIDLAYLP